MAIRTWLAGMAVDVGVVDTLRRHWARRLGDPAAYILFGHGVSRARGKGLCVEALAEMLEYLGRVFDVRSLQECVEALERRTSLRRPLLALTFDDGYADNLYHLLPVLKAHGTPATIFVTAGLIDSKQRLWPSEVRRCLAQTQAAELRVSFLPEPMAIGGAEDRVALAAKVVSLMKRAPIRQAEAVAELRQALDVAEEPAGEEERLLTQEELQELARDPLITIGGHTMLHPVLSSLPHKEACQEIEQGRQRLTEMTGERPTLFAYPNGQPGDYTGEIVQFLRDTGWQAAVTTQAGVATAASDVMQLPRLPLGQGPAARLAWALAKATREQANILR